MFGNSKKFWTLRGLFCRVCMLSIILVTTNCIPWQKNKWQILNHSDAKAELMEQEANDVFKFYGHKQQLKKHSVVRKTEHVESEFKQLCKVHRDIQDILNQSRAKADLMEEEIKRLFDLFVSEQGLKRNLKLCDALAEWFPQEDIPSLTEIKMLQLIYWTLETMEKAITCIIGQQKALNPNSSLIHSLTSVEHSTQGLLSNIYCVLYILRKVPPSFSPTDMPTPYDIFEQKVQGCRVLKTYVKFISEVSTGLTKLIQHGCWRHR
ncbi:oncostatin-M [Lissotriton helveticus]